MTAEKSKHSSKRVHGDGKIVSSVIDFNLLVKLLSWGGGGGGLDTETDWPNRRAVT